MKVLFIGDLHIGARNSSKVFHDYFKNYYETFLFPYILNEKIDLVIQLGDTLDKRKSIDFLSSKLLNETWFSFFESNKIDLYSIVGNHDIYFRNSIELSGLNHFKDQYKHIHIIDKISTINLEYCELTLCPWICESNKEEILSFIESQSTWCKTSPCILCGHFEFSGFQIHKGFTSEHDHLEKNTLYRFDKILSGHYHTPSSAGSISYIGTPYQITWNDYGDEKKVILYDTETKEFQEVFTPMKMFYKFYYTDELIVDFNELKRKYIKLILNDKEISNANLEIFLNDLENNSQPISIQIIDNRDKEILEYDEESIEVDDPLTILLKTIDTVAESSEQSSLAKEFVSKVVSAMEQTNDSI